MEYLSAGHSTSEVTEYLEAQSQVDAQKIAAGYGYVGLIVWALPILGFIGTVLGIGAAVSEFSGAVNAAEDMSIVQDSLTGVTSGLGVSFNTTLLALVMSMLVMFPKKFVQKREESLLTNTRQEKANESKSVAERIIGTWVLAETKRPGTPSGIGTRLKFYTGTHWMITQPDPQTGEIVFHHGGKYSIDSSTMSSTTDFAGANTISQIGKAGKSKIEIDGDTLKQIDSEGIWNETWKRWNPTVTLAPQNDK